MRRPFLRSVGGGLLLVLLAARTTAAGSGTSWLDTLNFYRATAALPPVVEEPALSDAVLQHARYMVIHDVVAHSQNREHSWATDAGAVAASVSNLAGSTRATEADSWAVDMWMQAPFHALGILDPALTQVGFGIHRAEDGRIQTAAGLDVIRGRQAWPTAARIYPVLWPAAGASVPIAAHVSEYPNPLTSCAGYQAPTGLPVIVQLGSGGLVPQVTNTWFADHDVVLDHCVFDESTYRNRDKDQERLGRSILAARGAVVLIPREPLRAGVTYRVVIDVNGQRLDWKFSVNPHIRVP